MENWALLLILLLLCAEKSLCRGVASSECFCVVFGDLCCIWGNQLGGNERWEQCRRFRGGRSISGKIIWWPWPFCYAVTLSLQRFSSFKYSIDWLVTAQEVIIFQDEFCCVFPYFHLTAHCLAFCCEVWTPSLKCLWDLAAVKEKKGVLEKFPCSSCHNFTHYWQCLRCILRLPLKDVWLYFHCCWGSLYFYCVETDVSWRTSLCVSCSEAGLPVFSIYSSHSKVF